METKTQSSTEVIEREINLTLINDKLNFIIIKLGELSTLAKDGSI